YVLKKPYNALWRCINSTLLNTVQRYGKACGLSISVCSMFRKGFLLIPYLGTVDSVGETFPKQSKKLDLASFHADVLCSHSGA
ncbi:690_t:CDS:1, partial [Funneliformis mosseae]